MRRIAQIDRKPGETHVKLSLNIDGRGEYQNATGIAFFDHMLDLLARHAVLDLELHCQGDIEVDGHHTVEDCGIAWEKLSWMPWGTRRAFAAMVLPSIHEIPSQAKLMCPWMSVLLVA